MSLISAEQSTHKPLIGGLTREHEVLRYFSDMDRDSDVGPGRGPKREAPYGRSLLVRWAVAYVAVALLFTATARTVLLGYADWLYAASTPEGVAAARRLLPGNADYFARRQEGDATNPVIRAIELNPYFSRGWIDLALAAELSGDLAQAEARLLEAYRRDRTYVPRWSLANFYFRKGDRERFWEWARRAAEMAPHDQSALFELCWRMSADGEEIQRKAIPPIPRIQTQYLYFLLRTGRIDAARAAAEELARLGGEGERDAVLSSCDHLLKTGRTPDAVALWNLLSARGLIPYPKLRPHEQPIIVNGEFEYAPLPGGFDWRIFRPTGVAVRGPVRGAGIWFGFDGRQPPSCELAAQVLPLEASRRYRLRYYYRTTGAPPGSGLHWRVGGLSTASWFGQSKDLSSEEWKAEEFDFALPPGETGARLVLRYERTPGTTRIEGALEVRWVSLEYAPGGELLLPR